MTSYAASIRATEEVFEDYESACIVAETECELRVTEEVLTELTLWLINKYCAHKPTSKKFPWTGNMVQDVILHYRWVGRAAAEACAASAHEKLLRIHGWKKEADKESASVAFYWKKALDEASK